MHPNELLARREIELLNAGDFEALDDLYTDDCLVHYPGRNPLAGTHSGDDFVARLRGVFEGGTITRDLHDALGTEDHAVQLLHVTASVGERSHSWNLVVVMHVQDGKFSEAWVHVDDQHALDDFLNSLVA